MRLLLVQYAGDYREAHRLSAASGAETYYGHQYLLRQLERIAALYGEAGILCCISSSSYKTILPSGVTVIGADADPRRQLGTVVNAIAEYAPTHLVVLGPLTGVIRWGLSAGTRVMCIFADSFEIGRVRFLLRYGRLPSLLNQPQIEWVANHGVNACRSLARIGVSGDKIIPWDWPYSRQPKDNPVKTAPDPASWTLFFAGSVSEQKGFGDLLAAVGQLHRRGSSVTLKVAGAGDIHRYRTRARQLGIDTHVQFLGTVSNSAVLQHMREASVVVVPSRHAYPEGLPLTIYEGLCARTPIVASDHPMFAGHLVHGVSAMIFNAANPRQLADRIQELQSKPDLYRSLSNAAQATWEGLQVAVKWGDLLQHWIADGKEDRRWLFDHRLNSGL